jgi:hypothetical protein
MFRWRAHSEEGRSVGAEPAAATAVAAEVMQALATTAGQADPYPHYARLRTIGPAVTGPDDVVVVVGHRACVSSCATTGWPSPPGLLSPPPGIPTGNPARHCG